MSVKKNIGYRNFFNIGSWFIYFLIIINFLNKLAIEFTSVVHISFSVIDKKLYRSKNNIIFTEFTEKRNYCLPRVVKFF